MPESDCDVKNETLPETQARWDKLLIDGWRANVNMERIIIMFMLDYGLNLAKRLDGPAILSIAEWLSEMGLERWASCREVKRQNYIQGSQPVRAMVAERCPHMSSCLFANKSLGNSDEEILQAISAFRWVMPTRKSSDGHIRKAQRKGNYTIQLRSLSKRHDWGTVK